MWGPRGLSRLRASCCLHRRCSLHSKHCERCERSFDQFVLTFARVTHAAATSLSASLRGKHARTGHVWLQAWGRRALLPALHSVPGCPVRGRERGGECRPMMRRWCMLPKDVRMVKGAASTALKWVLASAARGCTGGAVHATLRCTDGERHLCGMNCPQVGCGECFGVLWGQGRMRVATGVVRHT